MLSEWDGRGFCSPEAGAGEERTREGESIFFSCVPKQEVAR